MASLVYFQFTFSAITLILLAGSVLGRMNIRAWMAFMPLWLIFSYTVGAFSLWGGGFLYHWGVIDYSGGYVIHLSSGIAGLTAAYWVGPRLKSDRERFPPNNVLLMLAVLNTNVCAATSLLVWTSLDVIFFGKPSVIGAVQGMMTGLVSITPGAGPIVNFYTLEKEKRKPLVEKWCLQDWCNSDGKAFGQRSMGVDDDSSQEMQLATAGKSPNQNCVLIYGCPSFCI
ncbi:hypothetical protein V6N13_100993 [Hibiscus sabdariffa]